MSDESKKTSHLSKRAWILIVLGFGLGHPTVASRMAQQTSPHDNSAHVKSKYLNVLLWMVIALVVVIIGAWTIWASQQPELHSVWAPD